MKSYNVAILGAAGAVGQMILKLLAERNFPVGELRLLATARSAGTTATFRHREYTIEEAGPGSFEGVDVAFFCATAGASRELAPRAVEAGALVIDKSSAFRQDPEVPLVVPEVNPGALASHRGIVASPNCSTIQMVVALKPIHEAARIRRVVVSTYQSVSGTGREAIEELWNQTRQVLDGHKVTREVYPHQIAFNLIPQIDSFEENGYTGEEMKMVRETQKIFNDYEMRITATTVRVPVFYAHSESILVETERALTVGEARQLLKQAEGLVVLDRPEALEYPMPVHCAGRDEVFVGRIRRDLSSPNGLCFWVVADNLRKGAATNAVQIAEYMVENGLL